LQAYFSPENIESTTPFLKFKFCGDEYVSLWAEVRKTSRWKTRKRKPNKFL